MSLRRRGFDWLEQRGHTRALTSLGTAFVTARRRELCLVRNDDGDWVHCYRLGVVIQPELGGWTAQHYDDLTRHEWLRHYTPHSGDIVLDVGAGPGEQVRTFSAAVGPLGRVISIEAHPRIYRCLEKTVKWNSLNNVTALNLAVAETAGTLLISDNDNYVANTLTEDLDNGIEVESKTLDDIAAELCLDHIDLLKMNIEGAELAALRGMTRMLAQTHHVVIQCHDFLADTDGAEWQRTSQGVRDLLVESGLSVERHLDHPLPYFRDTLYGIR